MNDTVINLPDGTTLRFPPGTPQNVIDAAVRPYIGQATPPAPGVPPYNAAAAADFARSQIAGGDQPGLMERDQANQSTHFNSFVAGDSIPRPPQRDLNFLSGPLQTAAHGFTMGFGDELRGVVGGLGAMFTPEGFGAGYTRERDAARADLDEFQAQQPVLSPLLEMLGGVGTGYGLARTGASLINRARPTLTSIIPRAGAEGAAYGGVYGFGDAEGTLADRLQGAGEGAILGAAGGAAGGGVLGPLGRNIRMASTPNVAEQRAAAQATYRQAESLDMAVRGDSTQRGYQAVDAALQRLGGPSTTPASAQLVAQIERELGPAFGGSPPAIVSLPELERIRSLIVNSRAMTEEPTVGRAILRAWNDYMQSLTPTDIVTGAATADEALGILRQARSQWSTMMRAQDVEQAFNRARNAVGANVSSERILDAVRNEFRTIADDPEWLRTFSQDQQDAILDLVRGGPAERFLNRVGRLWPGLEKAALRTFLAGSAGVGVGHYAFGDPFGAVPVGLSVLSAGTSGVGLLGQRAATALGRDAAANVQYLSRLPAGQTNGAAQQLYGAATRTGGVLGSQQGPGYLPPLLPPMGYGGVLPR